MCRSILLGGQDCYQSLSRKYLKRLASMGTKTLGIYGDDGVLITDDDMVAAAR